MSWYSKLAWKEGLLLQPHHLQQQDRYLEKLIETRSRHITPYPWGFSTLEIDSDLSERNLFGLRRAAGIMPDGLPFDCALSELPTPVIVPENAEGKLVWLTLPNAEANKREIGLDDEDSRATRYRLDKESVADSAASMRLEQDVEIAHPRLGLDVRATPKPGFACMAIARIVEVRDKTILLDPGFAPPVLVCGAHPVVAGWLDRVIGWVETRLATLARYAADPGSGGGLQAQDYSMLLLLNREIGHLRHLRGSRYVHPERLYLALLQLSGELWTFDPSRLCPEYPAYDHDALEPSFSPVLRDIQRLLSRDISRAVRLDLQQPVMNSYIATVPDRALFRDAAFVIEVSADRPLGQIQSQFPSLCKVGPNTRMKQIVESNLPGLELVHMPTPPSQIRAVTSHVYFKIDKRSELWREFSTAAAIGLHFAGDWPELELEIWAIMETAA
ncbi:type VI secretion system baseplate subunit TssK [Roseibaca sp. V10]|uniref:Type VI secretion system baseplate subunit TssK n=1 Tax=Roseinatronobacter domitianus TaxID=2940293 RepID=A0ABT0M2U9_9RHOB|nr:type VI secretion system baseplate subunit TssK [Roseibaca domitiana]MCL1629171.1 type VI secretion system baseplate subunit TssK [Roseibaca domitiana]